MTVDDDTYVDIEETVAPAIRRRTDPATLVALVAAAVAVIGLFRSDYNKIGPYGLVQALNPLYFVGVVLLIGSFVFALTRQRIRPRSLTLHCALIVFLLQGAPTIVEPLPRFATAWLHVGFTDYVAQHGQVLPGLDARFNWPSFFSGTGAVSSALGLNTSEHLLAWWPVAIYCIYIPLIFLLARIFLQPRGAWLAAFLFPLVNWVGQDYYSPQSVAFLLYIAAIYIAVGPFAGGRSILAIVLRRHAGTADRAIPPVQGIVGVGALTLIAVAVATGHQLTPFILAAAVTALTLAGQTRLRSMPIFLWLIAIGWICFGAYTYWAGHFGELFGQVGSVGGNVSSGATSRVAGSVAHQRVVELRIVFALLVWSGAALGLLLRWLAKKPCAGLVVIFLVPFAMLAGQSYGGEILLRVFLFSLPATVILVAEAFSLPIGRIKAMCLFLTLSVSLGLFLVARWGNEIFEETRPSEIAGVTALYHLAQPGAVLASVSPQIAWRFEDTATYDYEPAKLNEFALQKVASVEQLIGKVTTGGFVIVTTGQIDYGVQAYGLSPSWGSELEALLTASGSFHLVYQNSGCQIYELVK
jgi:hypothetical protein